MGGYCSCLVVLVVVMGGVCSGWMVFFLVQVVKGFVNVVGVL